MRGGMPTLREQTDGFVKKFRIAIVVPLVQGIEPTVARQFRVERWPMSLHHLMAIVDVDIGEDNQSEVSAQRRA
jgi:hypothetical protein